jgi:hypothetical protein
MWNRRDFSHGISTYTHIMLSFSLARISFMSMWTHWHFRFGPNLQGNVLIRRCLFWAWLGSIPYPVSCAPASIQNDSITWLKGCRHVVAWIASDCFLSLHNIALPFLSAKITNGCNTTYTHPIYPSRLRNRSNIHTSSDAPISCPQIKS